jgi:hypothetical protein
LKGYETQVFIDIYEVKDDSETSGRWARLNNDLNGRGVPDPLAAIKDIFLGELYYRFIEIFKPEFVEKLSSLTVDTGVAKAGAAKAAADLVECAGVFMETALHFISGADGSYDAWIPSGAPALDEASVAFDTAAVDKKAAINEFEAFINRMAVIMDTIKKSEKLLPEIHNIAGGRKSLFSAIVLGYGVLSLLRSLTGNGKDTVDLAFTHWDLGRKLREVFYNFGASEHEAWIITDIARVVLSKTETAPDLRAKTAKEKTEFAAGIFAVQLIEDNYLDEDFRRILGFNIFDDITWFNKEGFYNTLLYASIFLLTECDSIVPVPVDQRIKNIADINKTLTAAEEKSGYRLDNFIDYLVKKPASTGKNTKAKEKRK